jgi:hypothetical protein
MSYLDILLLYFQLRRKDIKFLQRGKRKGLGFILKASLIAYNPLCPALAGHLPHGGGNSLLFSRIDSLFRGEKGGKVKQKRP